MKVINPHPITQIFPSGNNYIDGRPCFDPTGTVVLFERSGGNLPLAQFWSINIEKVFPEELFYMSNNYSCFRADWSWNPTLTENQIAFTGIFNTGDQTKSIIMLLSEGGENGSANFMGVEGFVGDTLSYPAWHPNGNVLQITNYSSKELIRANLNGKYKRTLTPTNMWAGMGTLNSKNPAMIAYAGQPVKQNGSYNQDINQVWLQNGNDDPILFSSDAPGAIGRAPWFSPEGDVIAFEAYANGATGKMQIFLRAIDSLADSPIIPVSNPNQGSQHAKFSPDGSKLVWAQNTGPGKTQIYMADIEY